MIALDEAATRPEAGAKAVVLARARRAGLPVLDGLVFLPDDALDAAALDRAVRARFGPVTRFIVRSSAAVEDLAGASAAGVFETVGDVRQGGLAPAIERVRASGTSAAARAYLAARGLGEARPVAVLVQPMAPAIRLGVAHSSPLVEGTLRAEERAPDEPEWGDPRERRVRLDEPLGRLVVAAAALVGGAADVEYAIVAAGEAARAEAPGGDDDTSLLLLQARPLAFRPPPRPAGSFRVGPPASETDWLRDAEHNPDPLSTAQASLVDLLNAQPGLPRQLVVRGYLYVAASPPPPLPPTERPPTATALETIASLPRRFSGEIEPRCDERLRPLESLPTGALALPPALDAFVAVARVYFTELSPALRAARRALDEWLRNALGEPLSQHALLLGGAAGRTAARDLALQAIGLAPEAERAPLLDAYRREFGAYAPAWDVATPCDDEASDRVLAAATLLARAPSLADRRAEAAARADEALEAIASRVSFARRDELRALVPAVRAALAVAEDDDALFFRAQRVVRRALLAHGQGAADAGLLDAPAQIFEHTVAECVRGDWSAARARERTAVRDEARALVAPAALRGGRAVTPTDDGADPFVLVGHGTSGRARGRAVLVPTLDATPRALPAGAVVVVAALLPSTTWLIGAAAAIVTDHGGALSHGATLSREYGVPAVLGTGSATRAIEDGEELLVDADAGRVYRLGAAARR